MSATDTVQTDPWGVVPQRLRPPPARADLVTREALLDRLLAEDAALVTVRAGAGYGKTTLMAQWAHADPRAVAWLSLDVADNDPVVLLRHLVRSLASCGLDTSLAEDLLQRREPQLAREVVPALAVALESSEIPFLMVLDDVHLLDHRDAVAMLDDVLDLVPDGSTFAMAGRALPALRLARRRLAGGLVQLDQGDLAYTPAEALAVTRPLDQLPAGVVQELVRCTEGWPAGLYLGVLALAEHPDPPLVLRGLLAGDQRVAEYLHEEVLDRLPAEWRTFLLRASILEQLSGPICDAVLERDGSAEVLAALAASGNLFVLSLEDRDAYRLHDLFAELLLAELRRTDPTAEAALRRRAARWHDDRGEGDAAVRQALASGDADLSSAVLYRQLFGVTVRGEVATLQRWVDGFPREQLRADGLVALCAGWAALSSGQRGALEMHLRDARTATYQGVLPDGTVSYEVGLAALEMTASMGGVKEVAEHAALVHAAGPGGSPWAGMGALLEAVALGYSGQADLVELLEVAELESRGLPAIHAVTVAQLGVAHVRRGDRPSGSRLIQQAVAEAREHRLEHFSLMLMMHGAHSYSAALAGDRAGSEAAAARAAAIRASMVHVVARGHIQTGLLLCEAAILRRDAVAATKELHLVRQLLPQEPEAVVFHEWADELAERLERLRSAGEAVELTAAERRVLGQLPTHRSLVEIGEHLYVSRNTVKTHTLSIYRKLGVSGRSEAVERAVELGLITPSG
jgi:LuxR family maltose regulon positive regulatory protein